MAVEEPRYIVIRKEGRLELRDYAPVVVAETRVLADFDSAARLGFPRLAAFIFGFNRNRARIAMTAPVTQEPAHAERSGAAEGGAEWVIRFFMPAEHSSRETLPAPADGQIEVRDLPHRKIAAIRYSGTWSESRYRSNLKELETWIRRSGQRASGPSIFARYNPPWTPWFLRRNEILIPLK